MEPDKPLHVKVAEALGCEVFYHEGHDFWLCDCADNQHAQLRRYEDKDGGAALLLRYDTDWSATGPLIEKYRMIVMWNEDHWFAGSNPAITMDGATWDYAADGATPLIAVCDLILVLKRADKLTA